MLKLKNKRKHIKYHRFIFNNDSNNIKYVYIDIFKNSNSVSKFKIKPIKSMKNIKNFKNSY